MERDCRRARIAVQSGRGNALADGRRRDGASCEQNCLQYLQLSQQVSMDFLAIRSIERCH